MRADYLSGQLGRAEAVGGQLIILEPRHVQALHLLSVVANRTNRKDLEFEFLEKVLAVDPDHAPALVGSANIVRAKGSTAQAVDLCRRAIERQPFYANAYNTLGLCRMSQKRPGDAAKCFNMALAYQPALAAAQQNLNAAFSQLGITTERERSEALNPTTAEEFEVLGWLMVFRRRHLEAIEMFERGLRLEPNSMRLLMALADQKRQHGEAKESIELWNRLIQKDSRVVQFHCGAGYAYQDLGMFDAAIEAFDQALALKPRQGDAHLGRATSRRVTKADEAIVQSVRDLCAEPSLSASERMLLHTALSKCEDDLGDYESAVREMDEANRIAQIEAGHSQEFAASWFAQRFEGNKAIFGKEFFGKTGLASEKPVFLVGLPRSGTTLAEQILSRHPQIAAGGEMPYWSDQESVLEGGLGQAMQDPVLSEKVARDYLGILERIGPNAERVTDKMPDNFAHIGFIHAVLPNARFIHCRRNVLDNCVSIYMTPFRNRPPMAYRREDILVYLRLYQDLMTHWRRVIPTDRLLDLDYEEVVDDREGAMRRVIEFLGLEWDDSCLSHEQNERSVNTPSSWQSRQPIYSTSVERWRRYEPWLGAFNELRGA
jgi:tetratricopeptide (TPR) repeat protein